MSRLPPYPPDYNLKSEDLSTCWPLWPLGLTPSTSLLKAVEVNFISNGLLVVTHRKEFYNNHWQRQAEPPEHFLHLGMVRVSREVSDLFWGVGVSESVLPQTNKYYTWISGFLCFTWTKPKLDQDHWLQVQLLFWPNKVFNTLVNVKKCSSRLMLLTDWRTADHSPLKIQLATSGQVECVWAVFRVAGASCSQHPNL